MTENTFRGYAQIVESKETVREFSKKAERQRYARLPGNWEQNEEVENLFGG